MSPNFNHINADEQLVLGSVTTRILADGAVTPAKLNIDADVDFNEFQALELRIENVASLPAPGNPGRLVWDTTAGQFYVDNGTAFVPIASGGAGVASLQIDGGPITTGAIQFLSGTNITLSQVGQNITINATGGGLSPTNFINGETPAGVVNGINAIFTLAFTPTVGSDSVYLNGVRLKRGALQDYTISGAVITMSAAPQTGDGLLVDYMK